MGSKAKARRLKRELMPGRAVAGYKVFISHGSGDTWLARQIAKEVRSIGGSTFLADADIPKGSPDFKQTIRSEVLSSRELVALFTPWSFRRSWVWLEMGAAWSGDIPILAVFYGMTVGELDDDGQGKGILGDVNVIDLRDFDTYLRQLGTRIVEAQE